MYCPLETLFVFVQKWYYYYFYHCTVTRGGGYSVQRTLWGVPPTWIAKSASWYDLLCKIWYMNGSIFQNFPKFEQNQFEKILEKSDDFAQNLVQNWSDWYMNGSLFLEKLVFVWVYFHILWRHIPTKTKLEYTPPDCNTVMCVPTAQQMKSEALNFNSNLKSLWTSSIDFI